MGESYASALFRNNLNIVGLFEMNYNACMPLSCNVLLNVPLFKTLWDFFIFLSKVTIKNPNF